ncbi:deoxyribodipyrimidine photo-lyase [Buchnera aphidicola (Hyadaphis tataricae)]|uniref:Deoxyribodipyrimidine photo-lyase n=1 Tax=Buchnera aphidicola (Hyadaphis tataricae) TaxID=1241859 RepID=A0A4D6XZK8_9GAMM|nr:deoxyribodipyrimidine photo-lyase [Buchnera aphidicola]QCI21599.1 deoxyribodipyrimidine photo-lyase [Buchnera aphidicola (Hyadaphis tataricae)]
MQKNLIWFRNDLRLYDNTALYEACKLKEAKVISLYIATPKQWKNHCVSSKKISFIHHHLHSLRESLFHLNIILHYYESTDFAHSIKYLINFCKNQKINNLFYNYEYEINERHRDFLIKKDLSQIGISVHGFHDRLLVSPKYIKNQNNEAYKVYSFFKKKIISHLLTQPPQCFPTPIARTLQKNCFLNHINFDHTSFQFNQHIFPIGENKAIDRLKYFLMHKYDDYSSKRNFPFLDNTSILSPYLSLGIISSRTCLMTLLNIKKDLAFNTILYSCWFNQILWREFYYHLLIGYPYICKNQSLSIWEKNIVWNKNIDHFNAWKSGNTGYPIVDAGMRQLNELGWMHNRLRMITASFLVKNLFINWRKGEKYFISRLIDGDFALNNGGWQWSASIGTDSTPYIRFLNPYLQSKNFDKSGHFIKQFIPALKIIPTHEIHTPHIWSQKNNYKINYPKPIVNFKESKKKSLLIFYKARLNNKKK